MCRRDQTYQPCQRPVMGVKLHRLYAVHHVRLHVLLRLELPPRGGPQLRPLHHLRPRCWRCCPCVLLLPPSRLTALWHVASEAYNSPGTTSPVWQAYQVPLTPTPFCSCPVRCCPAPSTNVMGACGKRDTNCVNSLGFPLSAAVMALASRAYSICEGVPPLYVSQDVAHHHACSAGTARIRRVLRWPA